MPKRLTPIRWTVELAASEFQIDRRTLAKRIRGADIRPGTDGKFSTEQICAAVFGDYRREQLREMKERADKLELENQCTRRERIPLQIVSDTEDQVFKAIAGIIKASGLPVDAVNEIFAQFRDIPKRLGWDLPPPTPS